MTHTEAYLFSCTKHMSYMVASWGLVGRFLYWDVCDNSGADFWQGHCGKAAIADQGTKTGSAESLCGLSQSSL